MAIGATASCRTTIAATSPTTPIVLLPLSMLSSMSWLLGIGYLLFDCFIHINPNPFIGVSHYDFSY
jgi:hypothetical protein